MRRALLMLIVGLAGPTTTAAPAHATPATVTVPARWIREAPDLARGLPRRVRATRDLWKYDTHGWLSHCYKLDLDPRGAKVVSTLIARHGGRDEEGVLVARADGHVFVSVSYLASFCFDYPAEQRGARMRDHAAASPLLAPWLPFVDQLGDPELVEHQLVAGSSPAVKLVFARAGIDLDRVDAWLRAHGLTGDRAAGWIGAVTAGQRAVVTLETRDGRELLVVMAVPAAG